MCKYQARPFERIKKVSSFPSQHFQAPFLVRFDPGNLDYDRSQFRCLYVIRRRQFPKPNYIFLRDTGLLKETENLFL